MKNRFVRLLVVVGFLFPGWAGAAGVTIENPWIQEGPPTAPSMAGYMVLKNASEQDRKLVSASSGAFASIMLHRSVTEGGMARMVHQKAVTIPAGGQVAFEPNSYHLMLMKPKERYTAGDTIQLELEFADGEVMGVEFEVRKPGMSGHQHMHH